jgi:hypothetical protein
VAAIATRTLNPLPFGDLEPHRFEDMVRQLAYDYRRWRTLEATGRLGADSGIDIRGIEVVPLDVDTESDEEDDEAPVAERLWIFQCKREKTLPPTRMRKVIKESLASLTQRPHGFVLAVASDVSAAARDVFRAEMARRGIEEFFIWGKSDLEDMLFQPKNDRLLFAYFGIALQPRRRTATTALRSQIAKRKQLSNLLGDAADGEGVLVLLRDPTDDRYPFKPVNEAPARWFLCRAVSIKKPGHLMVLQHQYFAAVNMDSNHWDAVFDFDFMLWQAQSELESKHAWTLEGRPKRGATPHSFWNEYIDEPRRAFLKIHRAIPLDRILAIDPLGDGPYPVPHLLVEFADTSGPFLPRKFVWLVKSNRMSAPINLEASDESHVEIFPKPLPGDDDPPPAGFDDTDTEAKPLTAEVTAKIAALVPKPLKKDRRVAEVFGDDDTASTTDSDTKLVVFQQWCDTVARPALSAIGLALRNAGHQSRLIVRGADNGGYEASIEIRIKLQAAAYYPVGRVRISCTAHMPEWRFEIAPPATISRLTNQQPLPKVSAATTAGELHAVVVAVLERMKAGSG